MKNRNVFMIFAAFIFGYCLQGMMNMYGGRLIEGLSDQEKYDKCKNGVLRLDDAWCISDSDCNFNADKDGAAAKGYCPWHILSKEKNTCDNGKFVVGECGQPPG